jgi:hypothetical protein
MITKKTWNEFRTAGLLWWANRILHLFGWSIVYSVDASGELVDVFPARVDFRGFSTQDDEEGFVQLTEHLNSTISELREEVKIKG